MFITGVSMLPSESTLTIEFTNENLPFAETYSTTLHLPTKETEYEVFKETENNYRTFNTVYVISDMTVSILSFC